MDNTNLPKNFTNIYQIQDIEQYSKNYCENHFQGCALIPINEQEEQIFNSINTHSQYNLEGYKTPMLAKDIVASSEKREELVPLLGKDSLVESPPQTKLLGNRSKSFTLLPTLQEGDKSKLSEGNNYQSSFGSSNSLIEIDQTKNYSQPSISDYTHNESITNELDNSKTSMLTSNTMRVDNPELESHKIKRISSSLIEEKNLFVDNEESSSNSNITSKNVFLDLDESQISVEQLRLEERKTKTFSVCGFEENRLQQIKSQSDDTILKRTEYLSPRNDMICPIYHDLMKYPVVSKMCGHIFDEDSIVRWIEKQKENKITPSCPVCRLPLDDIFPHMRLKFLIDDLYPQNKRFNIYSGAVKIKFKLKYQIDIFDHIKEKVEIVYWYLPYNMMLQTKNEKENIDTNEEKYCRRLINEDGENWYIDIIFRRCRLAWFFRVIDESNGDIIHSEYSVFNYLYRGTDLKRYNNDTLVFSSIYGEYCFLSDDLMGDFLENQV